MIGCGKVGYHLIKQLLAVGHEVLAVEQDPQRCALIREELGSVAIAGDGTESTVLTEAGANRCDVLIAVTGHDEDNLVASQLAKWQFEVPRTISLVNNPQNVDLFTTLGLDVTVSFADIILPHIEEELPTHPLVHVMRLKETNRELVGIKIPPDAAAVGIALNDLQLPTDCYISLIIGKDGHLRVPTEKNVVIQAEDEVVAITSTDNEEELRTVLTKANES